ncbi:GPR1/FUN34/yaaH family-domain-containing protein [Echria macrotheca]|uniref:GPR1/FUN34/yaaH family-domain-containing protein n=1 Tax=Echria macrotheca TaxID=438768 RepID=A0AAJ0B4G7_9PEZI|nr:GPR1/FUN34/yaaH family-domain-containing protein [Echria macrotheca]
MPGTTPNYSLRPAIRPPPQNPPNNTKNMKQPDDPLAQLRAAQTVNMSAELFEKLFLSQQQLGARGGTGAGTFSQRRMSKGTGSGWSDDDGKEGEDGEGEGKWKRGRRAVGNPTPIALVGIVIALTPLSCSLMGLLGAGGNGAAGVATYYFFGGLLLLMSGLMEWFLGNTFPSVVFSAYGAFFFSFAGTLTPSFAAFASYALPSADPSSGLKAPEFNASFAWILVWMSVLSMLFFICSLRTNLVLVVVFLSLIGVFGTLSAAYFQLAASFDGNSATAGTLVKAGGVCGFIASMAVWWHLLSALLEAVEFPVRVPLGDLSGWIRPRTKLSMV